MPIWDTVPVNDQPSVTLRSWKVIQTAAGQRHFVGYCTSNREGRVSSAIESFDAVTKKGITRSGRVYMLVGAPGHNLDAEYVLAHWLILNKVTQYQDVTDEVALLLGGAQSKEKD